MSHQNTRGLPQGGSLIEPVDMQRAEALGRQWFESVISSRTREAEPKSIDAARAQYAAAYNSNALTPSGPEAGVALPYGRVWVEGRSILHSAGSASTLVTLVATQNGVRATFTAPPGVNITAGSARFWVFDPITQTWSLGPVEETLATGVNSVSTSDQFITVGAQ